VIALLDGDVLAYRVGFASQTVSERFAVARMKEYIDDLAYFKGACDTLRIAVSTSGVHYRHKMAVTAEYKGNRKNNPKPTHWGALRKVLETHRHTVMSDNCEADDLLGHWSQEIGPGKCLVMSIDKDLLMLPGEHYNLQHHTRSTITETQGLLNFYRQIITGDTVDNIKGVYGIGPATAAKKLTLEMTEDELYKECIECFKGNRDRVVENGGLLWIQREPNQRWIPPDRREPTVLPS
jgi:hypothetical protein